MRKFTYAEASEFLAELNAHPSECDDGPGWFKYIEIGIDRDKFDGELGMFCAERGIDLNKGDFAYSADILDDAPIEALVVRFPYLEAK